MDMSFVSTGQFGPVAILAQHLGIGAVAQADIVEFHLSGEAIIHVAHLSGGQARGKSEIAMQAIDQLIYAP